MNLKLTRPLAFFDLETTGLNVAKDRIVEISILKVSPDGKEETYTRKLNPTIPMTQEASEITGIKDEDLVDMPKFADVGNEIAKYIEGCDLAGYNSNKFDVPLLVEEFLRAEIDFDLSNIKTVDVQVIFHKKEQRTLSAAYQFYCKKDLENAHSAEADTYATYEVLKGQIEMYEDLQGDVNSLAKFSSHTNNVDFAGRIVKNKDNQAVFNFGKNKGMLVTDVLEKNPGYYGWMMNSDFPLYTKKVLSLIKLSMTQKVKGGRLF